MLPPLPQKEEILEDLKWADWIQSAISVDFIRGNSISAIVEDVSLKRIDLGKSLRNILLLENAREVVESIFFIEDRPSSRQTYSVPVPLRRLAALRERDIGAGEILLLFAVEDSSSSFGGPIDSMIFEENWHVKQIRKADRRARMGGAKDSRYSSSRIAQKLFNIDPNFSQDLSVKLLNNFEEAVLCSFGTMENFWSNFRNEFLEREFSKVAGICFFDEDNFLLEFHRKDDVVLLGATQGCYRVKAANFAEGK